MEQQVALRSFLPPLFRRLTGYLGDSTRRKQLFFD